METTNDDTTSKIKEYNFISTRGLLLLSLTKTMITYIKLDEKSLNIDISPKRLNKAPVIKIDEILDIKIGTTFDIQSIIFSIVSLIVACTQNILFIFLLALWLYLGLNKKITIKNKNGLNVNIYSRFSDKDNVEEFVTEIRQRIGTVH